MTGLSLSSIKNKNQPTCFLKTGCKCFAFALKFRVLILKFQLKTAAVKSFSGECMQMNCKLRNVVHSLPALEVLNGFCSCTSCSSHCWAQHLPVNACKLGTCLHLLPRRSLCCESHRSQLPPRAASPGGLLYPSLIHSSALHKCAK